MSSQSGTGSSAAPHTNPFLEQSAGGNQYTSDVPLNSTDNRGVSAALNDLSGTGPTSSNDPAKQGEQAANQAISNIKGSLASLTDGQTKPNLAGDLAPSKETMSPDSAPEGTEHVSNILAGIGGALLSAPAAALEAVSPVAASKVSDGVHAISARLPHMSLHDATNAASNVANAAYSKLPAGTADTIKGYVGAAQHKAQEILPPALGGSPTHGNTGSGDLAKPPSQLANEYAGAAQASLSNAATQAQNLANQAIGATKQTASDAAAVTQQKASEAAAVTQQTAQDASNRASVAANDAYNSAAATANDASNRASATANDAYNTTAQNAQYASDRASELGNDAYNKTANNAQYASDRASEIGNDAYNRTAATANDVSSRAADNAQYGADSVSSSTQYAADRVSDNAQYAADRTSAQAQYGADRAQDYSQGQSGQSAGDILNRAAEGNTQETHANHPTTSTGAEMYPQGSNNPYASRSN